MALRKYGNIWSVYYNLNGKRIERSTGLTNKAKAELVDAEVKAELKRRRYAAKFSNADDSSCVAGVLADSIIPTWCMKNRAMLNAGKLYLFVNEWIKRGGEEKGDCQMFWIGLLQAFSNQLHVEYDVFKDVWFERQLKINGNHPSYIDLYLKSSKTLIEQKGSPHSIGEKALKQAASYAKHLEDVDKPRRIVLCNFRCFKIYRYPELTLESSFYLKDLPAHWADLTFLIASGKLS